MAATWLQNKLQLHQQYVNFGRHVNFHVAVPIKIKCLVIAYHCAKLYACRIIRTIFFHSNYKQCTQQLLTTEETISSRQFLISSITWAMATSCSTCIRSITVAATQNKPLLSAPFLKTSTLQLVGIKEYKKGSTVNVTNDQLETH